MGLYADAVNAVHDAIVAARATGQPLAYLKDAKLGEQEQTTSLSRPYAITVLDDPSIDEEWIAANERRAGAYRVLVVLVSTSSDPARPYGVSNDARKRGIVTLLEDTLNVIDAARPTILAANPTRLVSINVTVRGPRAIGKDSWEATIVVQITPRFTAGDR